MLHDDNRGNSVDNGNLIHAIVPRQHEYNKKPGVQVDRTLGIVLFAENREASRKGMEFLCEFHKN